MSSDRIARKRRSELDTSDNSADESPAVKIRKLDTGLDIGGKISKVFKNFISWITPGFIKTMAMRISPPVEISPYNNYRNQYIDVDDDEEIAFISMQNGTSGSSKPANAISMDSHSESYLDMRFNNSTVPLASTPHSSILTRDRIYNNRISKNADRKKVNGFPVKTSSRPKCTAPVTNPPSEIDILLDKDDDIEIIHEIYANKHSPGPNKKIRSPSDSQGSRTGFVNNASQSPYSSRSYTAEEVVRLQEKAQYKLLLDKVVKRAHLFQPAFPSVARTEEDDPLEEIFPFKKDEVEVNLRGFLSKYHIEQQNHTHRLDDKGTGDNDVKEIKYPGFPKFKPIEPTETLGPIFSDAWINDMRAKLCADTERRLKIVSEQEKKIQRFKNRREAKNEEEARKRDEMRLAGYIFPEDVQMEEVLPEITSEMHAIIDRALATGDRQVQLSVFQGKRERFDVTVVDLQTLKNHVWLNDQVLNFYLGLIDLRSQQEGYPSVHCFNTFFYHKVKQEGPRSTLRWTKKVDIFAHDLIVVPLHLGMHWALLVIDNRSKDMKYYDSMSGTETQCFKYIEEYLIAEMMDKKKTVLPPNTYSFEVPQDIPKQMNGCDCGVFALKYAEYISRDAPLSFTQENMPYFRRRMMYEILAKQIL